MILVATATDEYAIPYGKALRSVGVPEEGFRYVTPDIDPEEARSLATQASGLVLCGGVDVVPERYGETVLNDTVETLPERDVMEWALVEGAREAKVPVWGICRGIQVLNVFLGGSLWQDIPTQKPSDVPHSITQPKDRIAHTVNVVRPEMPLGEILTREIPRVNSRHHQAIKRLADGLIPVAESPDGLIEAVVLDRPDWWVRAVQWHPENLVAMDLHRALWTDFVRATR
ncbi:MAG TPA: gamma-glutamyl-gamma-aminobutyrate hydrolase family protein [Thermoanaerobaculia bacterium]|jgi:putative glutamine amidotransferase|nr:gamma-glutamyl-gamma-aminobutyrate hydrolase family protein [Thermoanaerobaculia bacterium]